MPYGTGGTGDIVGRLIGNSLESITNVPIIMENKPGGNGTIGRSIVARAKADGHTILVSEMSFTIQAGLDQKLPYDSKNSFSHIGIAASSPHILVVSNSTPIKNIHDLISFTKANPGKLNYGSGGVGSNTQLGSEILKSVAEIDIVHIPYKSSGLVIPDLIAGRVDILVSTVTTLLPYIKSGQVRPIVLLTDKRLDLLPTIPTVIEEGYKDMTMPNFWVGLAAPANTPVSIIDQLNHDMIESMNTPKVKSYMSDRGLILVSSTPEQTAEQVSQEIEYWKKFIKTQNIKLE
jgi:tripartite-type tricarboxylate transporter receptor subunit TctC